METGTKNPIDPKQQGWIYELTHSPGQFAESVIEWIIRICGISAIVFVFGIFFFVFREGATFLFGGLDLIQFLTSTEWYPSSVSNQRYGVLALIVGTLSALQSLQW